MSADHDAEELLHARAELITAAANADELQRALISSRRIGMAMGILMERHGLTVEQAFDRLRDVSQRRNVKVRKIAEELIYAGDTEGLRD